jgi:hypothetical protein
MELSYLEKVTLLSEGLLYIKDATKNARCNRPLSPIYKYAFQCQSFRNIDTPKQNYANKTFWDCHLCVRQFLHWVLRGEIVLPLNVLRRKKFNVAVLVLVLTRLFAAALGGTTRHRASSRSSSFIMFLILALFLSSQRCRDCRDAKTVSEKLLMMFPMWRRIWTRRQECPWPMACFKKICKTVS